MTAATAPAPTSDADLLGIRVAHRMMRRDARRLAVLAQGWADGTQTVTGRRARVFGTWTGKLCDEIHHHHAVEDDTLWPVLERHAADAIDLGALTDDHDALDPLLDGIRSATADAISGGDATVLAERLTTLADLLDEHITTEEAVMFPVITAHVPREDWTRVEEAAKAGGPGLAFMLPRFVAVVSDAEFATVRADAPAILLVLLRLVQPGHRRRERLLFG